VYFKITLLYKIDIPQLVMVKVDQERVDDGAQCTTCLETFELDEDVAKLDCQVFIHIGKKILLLEAVGFLVKNFIIISKMYDFFAAFYDIAIALVHN
jgi:hypothetical protein